MGALNIRIQNITFVIIGLFKNDLLVGKSLVGSKSLAVEIYTDLLLLFGSRVTKFGNESCLNHEIEDLIETPTFLFDLPPDIILSV